MYGQCLHKKSAMYYKYVMSRLVIIGVFAIIWSYQNNLFSMILQLPANTVHFYNTKIFLKWLVDCVWGDWKDESSCSKSCGHGLDTGVKHQVRVKIQNETHGGSCKGNSTRLTNCTTNIHCPSRFQILYIIHTFYLLTNVRFII